MHVLAPATLPSLCSDFGCLLGDLRYNRTSLRVLSPCGLVKNKCFAILFVRAAHGFAILAL